MSQLRSMVTEMTSFDPDALSAEELAAEIGEALHGIQLFETAVARWVKSLADRGGDEQLGYPSPTALLKHSGWALCWSCSTGGSPGQRHGESAPRVRRLGR